MLAANAAFGPLRPTLRRTNPDALQTALQRLRRQANAAPPPAVSPAPSAPPHSVPPPSGDRFPAVTDTPSAQGPRRRLDLARSALLAGRLEEARQYLEQAQLQLVFRPVTPNDDAAPGSSQVAGNVASALSMLGSGDRNGALEYVNRAMAEVSAERRPPPFHGYGYAAQYGSNAMAPPQPQ